VNTFTETSLVPQSLMVSRAALCLDLVPVPEDVAEIPTVNIACTDFYIPRIADVAVACIVLAAHSNRCDEVVAAEILAVDTWAPGLVLRHNLRIALDWDFGRTVGDMAPKAHMDCIPLLVGDGLAVLAPPGPMCAVTESLASQCVAFVPLVGRRASFVRLVPAYCPASSA